MTQLEIIKRLRHERDVMRSRVEAILTCEDAIESLEDEEVFGGRYGDLLFADARELHEAIELADAVIGDAPR